MATTNPEAAAWSRERVAWVVLGVLVVGLVIALVLNLSTPPQMGPDEEVFDTVDALFTAVTARDEKRLTECEARLHGYREAGKLPASAAEHLGGIIATARKGKWEAASERLYDFMLAQRRDGAGEKRPHNAKAKK